VLKKVHVIRRSTFWCAFHGTVLRAVGRAGPERVQGDADVQPRPREFAEALKFQGHPDSAGTVARGAVTVNSICAWAARLRTQQAGSPA
jgi:hypothetical protein